MTDRLTTLKSFENMKGKLRSLPRDERHADDKIWQEKEAFFSALNSKPQEELKISEEVIIARIKESMAEGWVNFEDDKDEEAYQKHLSELRETIFRFERVKDDVEIRTVEPYQKLQPGKMILINFPGNGTSLTDNDGNPKDEKIIRESAKAAGQNFVDFVSESRHFGEDECQVVSCYYSHKVNSLIEGYNSKGIIDKGIEKFAGIFEDLISKDGRRIGLAEAKRNMGCVLLRGHCFGTLVIAELEKALRCKMMSLGYSKNDRREILEAVSVISSSSPVALDRQPEDFKVVAYANSADTLIPTIKGSPNYQREAGFSNEEVASEQRQVKEVSVRNRKRYQLFVCSSLEAPSEQELAQKYKSEHEEWEAARILKHIKQALNGHAWNALLGSSLKETIVAPMHKHVDASVENFEHMEDSDKKLKNFLRIKKAKERAIYNRPAKTR